MSEGYKIWILVNVDYVMNWLFHAKGDKLSPVDLNEFWIKELGFSKIQVVVLDLLKQQNIVDDNKHIVELNNFFTSTRLLTMLQKYNFESVGTVRIINTKKNELKQKQSTKAQQQQKKKNKNLKSSIVDLKLKYEA